MVVTHALSLNINRRTAVRNLIGRRTESDRTANAIRTDGGRNLIGRRSKHDDKTQRSEQKKVAEARDLRY